MPTRHRLMVVTTVLLALGLPGMATGAGSHPPDGYLSYHVAISAGVHHGKFSIECAPRPLEVAARTIAWAQTCNQKARPVLDQAVKHCLIAPVDGLPFGKSSVYPPDYKPDPRHPITGLGRNFPLAKVCPDGKPAKKSNQKTGPYKSVFR